MTRALAKFRQRDQSLIDQRIIVLINVKPEQTQRPRRRSAQDVQKLQRFRYHIVIRLRALVPQKVLRCQSLQMTKSPKISYLQLFVVILAK